MEMIILIGCFWELELGYTSKCVYKQTGFETRFFVPIRIFMLLFFFFLRNISLAVAFQISCVFFLPPFSRKNPSLFVSSKEKKRKERRNEQKRWRFLDIYVFLFFFTPFLINVSIFYTAALKEKFFFFWERSVTREFIIIITLV